MNRRIAAQQETIRGACVDIYYCLRCGLQSLGPLFSIFALPVLACEPAHSDVSQSASFDGGLTDMTTLNDSFLSEINAHRCKSGLPKLAYNATLEEASKYHSDWMNKTKVFAHDSTVANMEKPWDRALHFGYHYQKLAENLALFGRYDFDGDPFYIQEGTCNFTKESGEKVTPISYADLARQVGTGWMNSPGHKANILLEGITEAAVGVTIDYEAEHCGRIYVTMLYGAPLTKK